MLFALPVACLLGVSRSASAQSPPPLVLATEFQHVPQPERSAVLPPLVEAPIIPPEIDGRLTDECWGHSQRVELGLDMPGGATSRRTVVRIYRDKRTLYVGFECREPTIDDMPRLEAPLTDVWTKENACVSIMPSGAKGDFYIFAIDPDGSKYDRSLRKGLSWSAKWATKSLRTPVGWNAEIAIPFSSLGKSEAQDGDLWRVNFGRDVLATGEQCAWAPTLGNRGNPAQWGRMFFGSIDAYQKLETPLRLRLHPERWVIGPADKVLRVVVRIDPGATDLTDARLRVSLSGEQPPGAENARSEETALGGERVSLTLNAERFPTGRFEVRVDLLDKEGKVLHTEGLPLEKGAPSPAKETPGDEAAPIRRMEIRVPKFSVKARAAREWPISTGVAFPKGRLLSPNNVRLLGPNGKEVPCETLVRSRWSGDGSIRWLGLDFRADLSRENAGAYVLEHGPEVRRMPVKGFTRKQAHLPFDVVEDDWVINTGPLLFTVNARRFSGIAEAWMDVDKNGFYDWTEQIVHATRGNAGPYVVTGGGLRYSLSADPNVKVDLEEWNELRLVLRGEGRLMLEGGRSGEGEPSRADLGRCVVRIFAYAGLPFVRVQYTFIFNDRTVKSMLTDVGVLERLYFRRRFDAIFGLPEGFRRSVSETGPVFMMKLSPDRFIVQNESDPLTVDLSGTGAKDWACAAAVNRGIAICLRDMGHLHPKEIEIRPDETFRVHFWPQHGDQELRRLHQDVNRRTVGGLGFAHSGLRLDLRVPAPFSKALKDREGLSDFDAVQEMHLSDPTGIALTHDLMYMFFAGDFEQEEVDGIAELFELRPRAVQDPGSLAASGVLTEMLPPDRADRTAAIIERLLKREQRAPQEGEFNYMGVHSRWLANEGRWALANHWVGAAGDLPSALWLTCLYTGNPEIHRAAERYLRHVLSMDICHTSTATQIAETDPRRRKIPGAFGDHRSPVHWQSTCHVNDRFARVRGLLLAYYLAGDLRARDVVRLWGEAAKTYGIPNSGEDGAVFLDNLSEILSMDYDAEILERLGECAEYLFQMPFDSGELARSAHLLRKYSCERGDPRGAAFLEAAGETVGEEVQQRVAAFEEAADQLLTGDSSDDAAITWKDLCLYVFGAAEPAMPPAPK